MNHGSLYSGIGGWLLAARWAGIDNVFTCEIDKFCNKVLDKHFPDTDRHYDIKETDFTKYRGTIDILSTSDPCQPFSFAGKRKGKEDDRFLWAQTIKAIQEIRPTYVVFENVPGFISLGFETVASDLEAEGYTVESFVIPACGVGAWHRRDRLWIIAYSGILGGARIRQYNREGLPGWRTEKQNDKGISGVSDTKSSEFESCRRKAWNRGGELRCGSWRATESGICRVAHGIPDRVDRLKSLGNSIVPQIALIIFEAIKQVNNKK